MKRVKAPRNVLKKLGLELNFSRNGGYTVHKLKDCLLPMECIPETQFLMRSKINLGLLLHM